MSIARARLPYLREGLYATYTGVAIVRVADPLAHGATRHAFLALLFGVIAIVIAGTVSEFIAHLLVHRTVARGVELRIMFRAALAALATAVIPLALILISAVSPLELDTALWLAAAVYIATLAGIGWMAVRRAELSGGAKALVLAGLVALGVLVVFVQQLAKMV